MVYRDGGTHLLEEHNHNPNMCPAPAPTLKAVCPRGQLQQDRVLAPAALEARVLFRVHFLVEARFGLDIHQLLAHTLIRRGQPAQLAETLEGLVVSALGGKPPRREWEC